MRRVLTVITVAAVAAATVGIAYGAGDRADSRAALQLASMKPLVVRGTGFHSAERVRVTVYAKVKHVKRTTASSIGRFRVAFGDVVVSRCDRVRVVAVGASGSRAELKRVPLPGCIPA